MRKKESIGFVGAKGRDFYLMGRDAEGEALGGVCFFEIY
jgi:hypothetical protein